MKQRYTTYTISIDIWDQYCMPLPVAIHPIGEGGGGHLKNTYELVNLEARKFSFINKLHIFKYMGKIFCVEFQRKPLTFHTKYLTHTLKGTIFIQYCKFKSSQIYDLVRVFETPPDLPKISSHTI